MSCVDAGTRTPWWMNPRHAHLPGVDEGALIHLANRHARLDYCEQFLSPAPSVFLRADQAGMR
ncbi:hypothetical protein STRIP9103_00964 [Streptomyces ipomoeae 91-03]|uniref:Uncharacterized protein n=1 Tax=Streptomyces ipomoeae 91-03 TaxID=698759 RepID=L1KLP1_9ACTN|nr:hypothetical protein STRIP9103_00964 [Streptomyces ipomoeae 91-03]